ncbi:hypothetical protein HDV00_010910 [Rhizophlyctis rosea]|nr:hypothetical protein HDV00_010910 [Rhizophlyctis rosea]
MPNRQPHQKTRFQNPKGKQLPSDIYPNERPDHFEKICRLPAHLHRNPDNPHPKSGGEYASPSKLRKHLARDEGFRVARGTQYRGKYLNPEGQPLPPELYPGERPARGETRCLLEDWQHEGRAERHPVGKEFAIGDALKQHLMQQGFRVLNKLWKGDSEGDSGGSGSDGGGGGGDGYGDDDEEEYWDGVGSRIKEDGSLSVLRRGRRTVPSVKKESRTSSRTLSPHTFPATSANNNNHLDFPMILDNNGSSDFPAKSQNDDDPDFPSATADDRNDFHVDRISPTQKAHHGGNKVGHAKTSKGRLIHFPPTYTPKLRKRAISTISSPLPAEAASIPQGTQMAATSTRNPRKRARSARSSPVPSPLPAEAASVSQQIQITATELEDQDEPGILINRRNPTNPPSPAASHAVTKEKATPSEHQNTRQQLKRKKEQMLREQETVRMMEDAVDLERMANNLEQKKDEASRNAFMMRIGRLESRRKRLRREIAETEQVLKAEEEEQMLERRLQELRDRVDDI